MPDVLSGAAEWAAVQLQRLRVRRQFQQMMGYDGDFENPRTYQEKIQFRKIYGNHAFYASVADKFRVREYVSARVGARYLVPLLGVYGRLTTRDFDSLPDRFIIKANHGCKWNLVVRDKRSLDIDATVRRFNRYTRRSYGGSTGERHYGFIKPRIVIEELLEGDGGGCPWTHCFFSYNNPSGFDYAYSLVASDGRAVSFTKEGEMLDCGVPAEELASRLDPPTFGEMVRVARALSAAFDFVRVDLYSVGRKVYFGELACTPDQGYAQISDLRRQKLRDEMWQLDAYNPVLYRVPPAYGQGRVQRHEMRREPLTIPKMPWGT
jgi:TupA-like ATPgrasp